MASVDLFVLDWDADLFTLDYLAKLIKPSESGISIQPIESIELAGLNGLGRAYEEVFDGNLILGYQIHSGH